MRTTSKTVQRMQQALAPLLAQALGGVVHWDEINLYPARGFWRQTKQDVQQFTGGYRHEGVLWSIGSWESMTDCLRYGFDFYDERGNDRADAHFVVSARGRRSVR